MDFQTARILAGKTIKHSHPGEQNDPSRYVNSFCVIIQDKDGNHRVARADDRDYAVCYAALQLYGTDFPLEEGGEATRLGVLNVGDRIVAVVDSFARHKFRSCSTKEHERYFDALQRFLIQRGPLSQVYEKEGIKFQRENGVLIDTRKWKFSTIITALTILREVHEYGLAPMYATLRKQHSVPPMEAWLIASLCKGKPEALVFRPHTGHTLFCSTATRVKSLRKILANEIPLPRKPAAYDKMQGMATNNTMDCVRDGPSLYSKIFKKEAPHGGWGAPPKTFTYEQLLKAIKED